MPANEKSTEDGNFSFVHLTDTHIMAGTKFQPSGGSWELDTHATLTRVLRVVNGLRPSPAFVVISGALVSPDLADRSRRPTPEEYAPSYTLLREALASLNCPVHLMIGNHDDRTAFHRVMGNAPSSPDAPHFYSFNHGGYHFVALDTQEPGKPGGWVDAEQFEWLRKDLLAHQETPTFVFTHHHLWPIGVDWMDVQNLRNGDEVAQLLRTHGNVQRILCGHVHQDHEIERGGLTLLTTPATCFQVSRVSQGASIFPGPPGFRLIRLEEQRLSTQVIYLHEDRNDAI